MKLRNKIFKSKIRSVIEKVKFIYDYSLLLIHVDILNM